MPLEHFASLGSLVDPELVVRGLERMQNDIIAARNEAGSKGPARGWGTAHHDLDEPLPIVTGVAFAIRLIAAWKGRDDCRCSDTALYFVSI